MVIIMIGLNLILLALLVFNIFSNSVNVIIVSTMIVTLVYKYDFYKYKKVFYYIFILLVLVSLFYNRYIFFLINEGIISMSMFVVVMFTGVLNKKTYLFKRLVMMRVPLSIYGFIAILPHAFRHLISLEYDFSITGVVAFVIVIILSIYSIPFIKKTISRELWKKIFILSYVFYIVLFIHVSVVSELVNSVFYIVLLVLYVNNKLLKELKIYES